MYLEFFKLTKMPFRLAPDPAFLYWSTGHSAALARVRSPLARQSGGVAVIGKKGAGKSTLLEYLQGECVTPAPIRLSVPPPSMQALATILEPIGGQQRGRNSLVLCDNAHLFAPQLLSGLLQKTLLGHHHASQLKVVLAGEPELAAVLGDPAVCHMSRALGEPFELPLLTNDETVAYVRHRLTVAGAPASQIFSDDVCAEIHRETRGNPRLVNALCDAALSLACARELPRVGMTEVLRGLEDIAALSRATENKPFAIDAPGTSAPVDGSALGHVQILRDGQVVLECDLTRGILRIGRGIDNDLRIDGRYISRSHCRIVTNERMSLLEDVRSTNGLYANNRRVRNHRLRDGDVIQLGEHDLRYADYRADKGDGD